MSLKRKEPPTVGSSPVLKKQRLLESRKRLPIWSRRQDIKDALRKNNVLVLSGETGSGKSSQIPQFLVDQQWCTGKIAVTQPRRVAAITLAKRVADEMGTPCGRSSPASKVGYSVRFDESTSPSTRIKYLTEGMLLKEMLKDAALEQYSCIIVDEVHERSVNVDLILGFLKNLLSGKTRKTPLKVVVMSATVDVDSISQFFNRSDKNATIDDQGKDSAIGGTDAGESIKSLPNGTHTEQATSGNGTVSLVQMHIEGRQYPVTVKYLDSPTDDVLHMAMEQIFLLHCKEAMPGDILVFLTGQETILTVQKLVEDSAQNLTRDYPKLLVLPLYAALSQAAQQLVFQPGPPNTRKIILCTNIAETSVTVPGVRFVIDTGKAKFKQFHNKLCLDSLLVKPISKSSADQRKGRAGRESAGQCIRLYTKASYEGFENDTKPEILRSDLSDTLLNLIARAVPVADVFSFPFLTPPPRQAMETALVQLHQLHLIEDTGKISTIGHQVARLPLHPNLGRVVVEAAMMDCLPEVIDIVAGLSSQNLFPTIDTEEAREQAQIARREIIRRQGDHLTILAAVQGYAAETANRRRWAEDRMISHRAMQNAMDVRKQLHAQCSSLLMKSASSNASSIPAISSPPSEEKAEAILKAFLPGYITNCARLRPDGSYQTARSQTIAIHPSSVLFGRKVEAIMYDEFVYTSKAYARNVSAVQMQWLIDAVDKTVSPE